VEALKQFHYEYDEVRRTYTTRPEHDWSSHTSDAFRYAATGIQLAELLSRPKADPAKPKPALRPMASLTMNELWEIHEEELNARRGRIR